MSISRRIQLFIVGILDVLFRGYNISWLHLHRGDFAAFLTQEVARVGGRVRSSKAPPPFQATWIHQSDDEGFMIGLPSAEFSQVVAVLGERFGPTEVAENLRGSLEGDYGPENIGIILRFFDGGGGVTIMCTKGR